MANETPRTRIGIADAERVTGLSRTTIDRKIRRGEFPPGVFIGERRKWFIDEIETWVREQASRPRRGAANLDVAKVTP